MTQIDHVNENVKTCLKVFPLLAVLILVTVGIHQANLPYKFQLIVEIIKAVIAVGYLLHLIANKRDINTTWILTLIFVLALVTLPIANAFNHINGSGDTSREVQSEKLASQSSDSEKESHHNVH